MDLWSVVDEAIPDIPELDRPREFASVGGGRVSSSLDCHDGACERSNTSSSIRESDDHDQPGHRQTVDDRTGFKRSSLMTDLFHWLSKSDVW